MLSNPLRGTEMLTIQRSFYPDKKAALAKGIELANNVSAPSLYRAIADYLSVDVSDIEVGCDKESKALEVAAICDRIDERNQDLACAGVAESCIQNESTVVDKMAARIGFKRPVLRPIKPVQRPRIGGLEVAIMRPKRVEKPKLKSYSV
jgi:hypothetical protein